MGGVGTDPGRETEAIASPNSTGLAVSTRSYDGERRRHRHGFVQLLLPERGRLRLLVEGEAGAVDAARLALIPAGAEHHFWAEGDGPNRFLVADLAPAVLVTVGDEAAPDLPGPFLPMAPRFGSLAALLRTELAAGGLADPLLAEALGRYLAAALRRPPPPLAPGGGPLSPAARRVARLAEEYLRANAAAPLTVAEVAAAVGASPSHLQRAFRAHAGCSLVAYVHRLRVERAGDLLRETDLSVLEVAAAVGVASPSHLARLFARYLGLSPSRYRALAAARAGSGATPR